MKLRLLVLLSILVLVLCTEKHDTEPGNGNNDTTDIKMAIYYVDPPTGVDSISRDGTNTARAWKTLSYACTRVTTSGDIIQVNAGTIVETSSSRAVLSPNVSIRGAGRATTIITCNFTTSDLTNGYLVLSGGTNTSQSISGITFDGNNFAGDHGIIVYARSNVSIYDCTVQNFHIQGVRFEGTASNNSMYNSTITNCSGYISNDRKYGLYIRNQTNFQFYNNVFTQVQRSGANTTGDGIRYENGNRGCKIYNNTLNGLYADVSPYNEYSFLFEAWENSKVDVGYGLEIYGNTIVGEFDFGSGCRKGSYAYAVSFHDNICGPVSPYTYSDSHIGLQFEEVCSDILIYNNKFKNTDRSIYFCNNGTEGEFRNIKIYHNVIRDCFYSDSDVNIGGTVYGSGWGIFFGGSGNNPSVGGGESIIQDIDIDNNTIVAYAASPARIGIWLDCRGPVTRVNIRNNIIQGFSQAFFGAVYNGGSCTYLVFQKNILYNNGNSNNIIYSGMTNTGGSNDGGIKMSSALPFVNEAGKDYNILATFTEAINAGVALSYTVDINSNPISGLPDIGAYENGSVVLVPVTSVTVAGAGGSTSISTPGGTLQLTATCLPANATDKTVVWSVTNGTGSATINQSGLLTAITNGTVTGKATSNG